MTEGAVLWQGLLLHDVPEVCAKLMSSHDAIHHDVLRLMKESLCIRSWALYRAVRSTHAAGESFCAWRKLFGVTSSTLIADTNFDHSQEMCLLLYLRDIANMIFESCLRSPPEESKARTSLPKATSSQMTSSSLLQPLFQKVTALSIKPNHKRKARAKLFTRTAKQTVLC